MSAAAKSKAKKTKKKSSKRKSAKAKVYIPPYRAIILCVSVITICMALLLVTSLKENPDKLKAGATAVAERFEKSDKKIEQSEPKTEKNTSEKSGKSEKKQTPSLDVVNNSSTKKTEEKKSEKKEADTKPSSNTVTIKPQKENTSSVTPSAPQANVAVTTKPEVTTTTTTTTTTTNVSPVTPPVNSFNFPQAKNSAQLVFVFDDGGQNVSHLNRFLKLPFPITVAVLPKLAHSKESGELVRKSGNELILHQPMQAVNLNVNPGPGAITPDMDENQIMSTLFQNINEIGPISGMNNHEGSLITADAEKMSVILRSASENGIYFLDSRTNSKTAVPYVASEMGYTYYERNIFLDNEKTRANALKELKKGLDIANKNGVVIMIGHIWSADFLPAFLEEVYPELKAKGYTFKTVSNSRGRK